MYVFMNTSSHPIWQIFLVVLKNSWYWTCGRKWKKTTEQDKGEFPEIIVNGVFCKDICLTNVVEAPLKNFFVELWCLCCMMMFKWTNKQPGIQMFWNICGHYQDICDWISPLNKLSGLPFILTQQSMGRYELQDKSGHLPIIHLFEALNGHFWGAIFSNGFIFTPYQRQSW